MKKMKRRTNNSNNRIQKQDKSKWLDIANLVTRVALIILDLFDKHQ